MSADRELLEFAAKAAGIEGEWSKTIGGWDCLITSGHHPWQPLHDDGDALRLALACGLRVRECEAEWWPSESLDAQRIYEPSGDDPYAATRRAIVRAAAAIGSQQ